MIQPALNQIGTKGSKCPGQAPQPARIGDGGFHAEGRDRDSKFTDLLADRTFLNQTHDTRFDLGHRELRGQHLVQHDGRAACSQSGDDVCDPHVWLIQFS